MVFHTGILFLIQANSHLNVNGWSLINHLINFYILLWHYYLFLRNKFKTRLLRHGI